MMADLITALGLCLAIEGLAYALFPEGMKTMMVQVLAQPAGNIRVTGVAVAGAGVFILWLVRGG